MRIYFDMCSLQRPLDDQSQLRVRLEAEAINAAIASCEAGHARLMSSVALDLENERNPYPHRRAHVASLLAQATESVQATPGIERHAEIFIRSGLKAMDALHLAIALDADADYFCTCDDRLLKRARTLFTGKTKVVSPLELLTELGL